MSTKRSTDNFFSIKYVAVDSVCASEASQAKCSATSAADFLRFVLICIIFTTTIYFDYDYPAKQENYLAYVIELIVFFKQVVRLCEW